MKIIEPSHEILDTISGIAGEGGRNMLRLIELAARNCYKSEDAITCDSHGPFVTKIATVFKHESVIEHAHVSVRFICDRGVTHEMVRHRLAAYSQESTRYCNYSKDKFGSEITVIRPEWVKLDNNGNPLNNDYAARSWIDAMKVAELEYLKLLKLGWSAQQARSVLPNSLKTEIIMTCNLREWQHVFRMRCSTKAHPQMQQLMKPLLAEFQQHLPELFKEINPA